MSVIAGLCVCRLGRSADGSVDAKLRMYVSERTVGTVAERVDFLQGD